VNILSNKYLRHAHPSPAEFVPSSKFYQEKEVRSSILRNFQEWPLSREIKEQGHLRLIFDRTPGKKRRRFFLTKGFFSLITSPSIGTKREREGMTGPLLALLGSCFFGSATVVVRQGMKKTRENGVFIATFINLVIFGVLLAVLFRTVCCLP